MELAGKTFGRLEVVARMEKRKNNVYWLCKCSCGKDAVVEQGNLTRGKTKSCGCLRVDKINTMLSRKRDGAFIKKTAYGERGKRHEGSQAPVNDG